MSANEQPSSLSLPPSDAQGKPLGVCPQCGSRLEAGTVAVQMNSASANRALVVTVALLLALAVALYFYSVWLRLNGPPFVVVMTPSESGALLQFVLPEGSGRDAEVSPLFHVDVELDSPIVRVLNSGSVEVPGGDIEFYDMTITPGAFHIRFGDDLYRVMEASVNVGGVSYGWVRQGGEVEIVGDVE